GVPRAFPTQAVSESIISGTDFAQSQRDCALQPRVARSATLSKACSIKINFQPQRGCGPAAIGRNPVGVGNPLWIPLIQGSRVGATLGSASESLWDSRSDNPKKLPQKVWRLLS